MASCFSDRPARSNCILVIVVAAAATLASPSARPAPDNSSGVGVGGVPTEAPRHPDEDAHAGGQHDPGNGHEEGREIHLRRSQREALGLETQRLALRQLGDVFAAPGEVRLNAYATSQVTPRIEAQVLARQARLGDKVEKGQPMVALSSVDMAEAQGDLIVAEREWERLSKLKGQFVSERDYLEASVARDKALSRVLAYGMTRSQADALVSVGSEKADGTFELLAPQTGTVIQDPFVLGELVEPGRLLFEVTDESVRWVEARMAPREAGMVGPGDAARVRADGIWLDGRVAQIHHQLDEKTRTQAVRIEVPDPDHRLHPGVFVDVVVLGASGEPQLSLPESAVLRSPDGDWQVFVAGDEDGAFEPVEVELVRTLAGLAVIKGVPEGTQVVTRGAFFLQSELAKSGFDIHQH
jgi:cobalt-zinc-cadmium efflux system membrane fusion protein